MRSEHKADLLTGLVLMALGAAAIVGGLTMDRLEIRQIHPASIPGLVPTILGGALAIAALALVVRAVKRLKATDQDAKAQTEGEPTSVTGLAVVLLLTVGYAVGLVGNVSYEIATGVFVFLFIAVFEWHPEAALRVRLIRLATALLQAVLVAVIVSVVFEHLFLVRLP